MKTFYGVDGGYGFLLIFLFILLCNVHFIDIVDHIYYIDGLFLQLPAYFQEFVHCMAEVEQNTLCLFVTFFNLFRYLVFFIRREERYMSYFL